MPTLIELVNEHERIWKEFTSTPLEDRKPPRSDKAEQLLAEMRKLVEEINAHPDHRDFEKDLESALTEQIVKDEAFAKHVYAALCNVTWKHELGTEYSCSWRYAGDLIARIRNIGEDYLHFYCSGGEGSIRNPRIAEELGKLGWKPLDEEYEF